MSRFYDHHVYYSPRLLHSLQWPTIFIPMVACVYCVCGSHITPCGVAVHSPGVERHTHSEYSSR
jgi:hypothetical protein